MFTWLFHSILTVVHIITSWNKWNRFCVLVINLLIDECIILIIDLLNFNSLPLYIPTFCYFQSKTVFPVCCSCRLFGLAGLPFDLALICCQLEFGLYTVIVWSLQFWSYTCCIGSAEEKENQIYGLLTVCRFMSKQKIYMNRSSSVETKHWIFSLLFLLHCFYYYCIKGPLITATTNVLIKVPLLSYIVVTSSWPLSLYHLSICGPWKLTLGSRWRKALFVCLRSDLLMSTLLFSFVDPVPHDDKQSIAFLECISLSNTPSAVNTQCIICYVLMDWFIDWR